MALRALRRLRASARGSFPWVISDMGGETLGVLKSSLGGSGADHQVQVRVWPRRTAGHRPEDSDHIEMVDTGQI